MRIQPTSYSVLLMHLIGIIEWSSTDPNSVSPRAALATSHFSYRVASVLSRAGRSHQPPMLAFVAPSALPCLVS